MSRPSAYFLQLEIALGTTFAQAHIWPQLALRASHGPLPSLQEMQHVGLECKLVPPFISVAKPKAESQFHVIHEEILLYLLTAIAT